MAWRKKQHMTIDCWFCMRGKCDAMNKMKYFLRGERILTLAVTQDIFVNVKLQNGY